MEITVTISYFYTVDTFLEVEGQESSASSFAPGGDAFEQEMPILNDRRSHAISISSTATRFISIS